MTTQADLTADQLAAVAAHAEAFKQANAAQRAAGGAMTAETLDTAYAACGTRRELARACDGYDTPAWSAAIELVHTEVELHEQQLVAAAQQRSA